DDDVLQSYSEYSLAQLIYYAMKESACSEQASRMTAMDGASKNAAVNFRAETVVISISSAFTIDS
ncbi:hypothetical protein ANCDUO_21891, partial [Ancylostoma duodenale]